MADTTHDDDLDFSHYPAQRGTGRRKVDRPKWNWSAVGVFLAALIAIIGGVSGWFGANAQELKAMNDRLTTLEAQRQSDTQRTERIEKMLDRVDSKVDQLLDRR